MGFIDKIKNFFGIGGVKVQIKAPGQISKAEGVVNGTIILTSKSDQEVVDIEVKLVEEFTTGRGDNKSTEEYTLGEMKIPGGYTIKAGETKEVPYSLPWALLKSNNDELAEKGGMLGGIGKLGKFASAEKSAYKVWATCDVKSATFDPNDSFEVKVV